MASKQSPFWNQDAIMAGGLAFAGMAILQSKLFPSVSWTQWPLLHRLMETQLIQWWPALLITAGVAFWIGQVFERRSRKSYRSVVLTGGQGGRRQQNQN
jgi:hypothetical protein